MDKLYFNTIPSLFFIKQNTLVAPPGVSIDKLAEIVGSQIARTIIHEAAHGKRWAQEYLSGNMKLQNLSTPEEEMYAEQAESRSGLSTELTSDVFDDSETEDMMDAESLLSRAVQISNSKNDFYIPRNSIKNVDLSQDGAWGQFEMIQGEEMNPQEDITVAWDENNRKLLVDVESIINEYNKAISQSDILRHQQNQTRQDDGMEPDVPGVSQDPPTNVLSPDSQGIPSIQPIPSY